MKLGFTTLADIWLFFTLSAVECNILDHIRHKQDHDGNVRIVFSDATSDSKSSLSMLFNIQDFSTAKEGKKSNKLSLEDCSSGGQNFCYHHEDKLRLSVYRLNHHCQTVNYSSKAEGSVKALINLENIHLYGGAEHVDLEWPIDKMSYDHNSYVTKVDFYQAILESYWLTSNGYYFYVDQAVPLFISLDPHKSTLELEAQNAHPYHAEHRHHIALNFTVCKFANAKVAHQHAVQHFLGMPTAMPDVKRVKQPIWSTWVRYKENITSATVLKYAQEIRLHGFSGQVEIDDDWETCYGSLTPSKSKFPDLKQLVKKIKEMGFRVTIWIHPFVNTNCNPTHAIGVQNGFFVKNSQNETTMKWWRGYASYVDFTNPAASKWFRDRLLSLMDEYGVDSFKFDGGESGFSPRSALYYEMDDKYPETIVRAYVRMIASLGKNVHTRVARSTQRYPIFVTMMDRDSRWGKPLGLRTLIPQLLQLNILGYSFVLPDMIGGNFYGMSANDELYIRWLQANVFMPSLQFSVPPWDYGEEYTKLAKKFVDLHAQYADRIVELMQRNVETGDPVNPPLWWIAPNDPVAQVCDSEFLLGDDLLIAPVLVEGATSRDIYLPEGFWSDGNNDGVLIRGPVWLRSYAADLTVLPYFTRMTDSNVEGMRDGDSSKSSFSLFSIILISVVITVALYVVMGLLGRCFKLRKRVFRLYNLF